MTSSGVDVPAVMPTVSVSLNQRGSISAAVSMRWTRSQNRAQVRASSPERFKIPRNVLGICLGKSTYARCGIIVNVTPLEPGWEGILTIEISNTTPLPAKIYSNEGIAQILFFESDEACETSYADRKGKYQDQVGVVLPRILASQSA